MEYIKENKEEIETQINIDYFAGEISFYTSRRATIRKLREILGEPKYTNTINGKIDSMQWYIPLNEREKIKRALALYVLIPQKRC